MNRAGVRLRAMREGAKDEEKCMEFIRSCLEDLRERNILACDYTVPLSLNAQYIEHLADTKGIPCTEAGRCGRTTTLAFGLTYTSLFNYENMR